MTLPAMLNQATADGVEITAKDGRLKITGPRAAAAKWAGEIRKHKPEILQALEATTTTKQQALASLTQAAKQTGADLSELVSWYSTEPGDLEAIAALEPEALVEVVRDFLGHRPMYAAAHLHRTGRPLSGDHTQAAPTPARGEYASEKPRIDHTDPRNHRPPDYAPARRGMAALRRFKEASR